LRTVFPEEDKSAIERRFLTMYLALNDEQKLLAQTVQAFVRKELPSSKVRQILATEHAYDAPLWQQMAEQGWMGLTVPTAFGGLAESWLTVAVLFEELGKGMVPGPFLATVGLAAPLLAVAGSDQQKARWLSAIAEGTCRASVAYLEPDAASDFESIQTTANEAGEAFTLSGTKMFVLDAGVADVLLVTARAQGKLGLFLVEQGAAGLRVETLEGMDLSRRVTRVTLDKTPAEKLDACPDPCQALDYALNVAGFALSAEGVGGMQWILDTAVAYAKTREQYGHLIGSYQGVSYPLVDRALDLNSARSAVYHAAYALDHEPAEIVEAVSMAKALVSDGFRQAGYTGVQTLGGIGFTWEHDMQLYFRRASGTWSLFGDPNWHRERLLQSINL
jgi:alkylation response protein AidB-like acyl-CoA dehydrogenase